MLDNKHAASGTVHWPADLPAVQHAPRPFWPWLLWCLAVSCRACTDTHCTAVSQVHEPIHVTTHAPPTCALAWGPLQAETAEGPILSVLQGWPAHVLSRGTAAAVLVLPAGQVPASCNLPLQRALLVSIGAQDLQVGRGKRRSRQLTCGPHSLSHHIGGVRDVYKQIIM